MKVEYQELEKFVKSFKTNFDDRHIEMFFNKTSSVLTKELYDKLRIKTPVKTGFLRHGWNVGLGMKYHNARLYPKKQTLYNSVKINFNKITPDKEGNKYTVYVKNPVHYAPFVEYGHKVTTKGRKPQTDEYGRVKLIGTNKWVTPYTKGHNMTYLSVEEMKTDAPQIIRKEFYKFLKG